MIARCDLLLTTAVRPKKPNMDKTSYARSYWRRYPLRNRAESALALRGRMLPKLSTVRLLRGGRVTAWTTLTII